MIIHLTERRCVNKPRSYARPLADLANPLLAGSFARQGFASAELVTRWPDIVGAEIAMHCEPLKMQWPRTPETETQEPGTLVLRVEGPASIEIQHMAPQILERVNRFFGFAAVGKLALRQAPIARRPKRKAATPDPEAVKRMAESLPRIDNEDLKDALARLGASVKREPR
jgi:hypothetical protein